MTGPWGCSQGLGLLQLRAELGQEGRACQAVAGAVVGAEAGLDHIRLEGSRGGAGLVAAACNALLRAGGPVAENPPSLS